MESEKNFQPKPEEPKILYHASSNSGIEKFEPRSEKTRDEAEGPRVFATPNKALASVFLVETDDSWVQSGMIDNTPYIIISDKERFESLDNGGTIYSLPSDSFETDIEKGLRDMEYTSGQEVAPIEAETVDSALETMIQLGVKVFFVDDETFKQIQKSEDEGESILKNLTPA